MCHRKELFDDFECEKSYLILSHVRVKTLMDELENVLPY
jgi:hypothetical protein